MENNQKPEWFELADNDQPTSRPLKKKAAPMRSLTFILAGVLVIPMGAGFALLTHEDPSATASETLNLVQDSPAATSSTQALSANTIAMPTASREDDDEDEDDDDYRAPVFSNSVSSSPTVSTSPDVTTKTPGAKAPVAITPPGSASNEIILPPSKKAGDDDDDDDDDDDVDDEEDDD
jgi:cytoskeletal protein RodZ